MSQPAIPANPIPANRRTKLIEAAQESWVSALTDLGGRNTLLYYKDRRSGTLDLAAADPAAVEQFISGGSIRLTRLFRDLDARADAIRRVQVIYRKAKELLEERGIRAGRGLFGARRDSSQRSAIAAVLSGRSLVVHGPPGTGKSQTIANLQPGQAGRAGADHRHRGR